MKKKIGLLLNSEPQDGGKFQYNLAMLDAVSSLPAGKFSVIVGYTSDSWSRYLNSYNLQTVFVPKGFFGRAFARLWIVLGLPIETFRRICPYLLPIAKTLMRKECDLWIFPSPDAWSYLIPVPALVSIYDLMHLYEGQFPEVSANGEYQRRERHYRNINRWSKAFLVDSKIGRQHVMESYGFKLERIHILPYIAPKYIYSHQTPDNFDSVYNLPEKFIFYPAQFWEHKNHKLLIRAIKRLKPEIPDIKLVLVGSQKNGYKSTSKLVQDLNLTNDVLFLGYVPEEDITEIYRRARAMIMPTFFGPTNIPPLEAMATGCPAAISNVYGMTEQVGNAALSFDPSSEEEIADAIMRLWTDDHLCSDLSRKGKIRDQNWRQTHFNKRLENILTEILPVDK